MYTHNTSFSGGIRLRRVFATVFGLSLLAIVLVIGWRPLSNGLQSAGWSLLWLLPVHAAADALDSLSWRTLLPSNSRRPGVAYFAWAASLRDAASSLLPVIGAAAPLLGVSMLRERGVSAMTGFASVVVESTLSLVSQSLFMLAGTALSVVALAVPELLWLLWPPALVTLVAGIGFIVLQRHRGAYLRFFWMIRRLHMLHRLRRLSGMYPIRLFKALRVVNRRPSSLATCIFWQLIAYGAGTLELWLMLVLLHQHVSFAVPLLLWVGVRLSQSLSFVVPAGLGVQEGVFAGISMACGLPVSIGLGLSLISRCRDVMFGTPLLLSWLLRNKLPARSRGLPAASPELVAARPN